MVIFLNNNPNRNFNNNNKITFNNLCIHYKKINPRRFVKVVKLVIFHTIHYHVVILFANPALIF